MKRRKIILSCVECNADFTVQHSMDEERYEPRHCVFCGAEILNEEDDLNVDEESEEDDYF